MSHPLTRDPLTGLLNRSDIEQHLQSVLADTRTTGRACSFCHVDLDGLGRVNHQIGHAGGDQLLHEIAELIRGTLPASAIVARTGGDEFWILLPDCRLVEAKQTAERVVRAIAAHQIRWEGETDGCGAHAGIVELSRESGTVEDVISAAEFACSEAKRRGASGVHAFSAVEAADMCAGSETRWRQELQTALSEGRLELEVRLSGSEASDIGLPSYDREVSLRVRGHDRIEDVTREFLRRMWRHGLLPQCDRWLMQELLAQLRRGTLTAPADRAIGIPVAIQTIGDAGFLEFVHEQVSRSGVDPNHLCFVLPEPTSINVFAGLKRFADGLREKGYRFQPPPGTDPLTGLPSRSGFERHLAEAMRMAHSAERTSSLCHLALDRLGVEIRDEIGLIAGDQAVRVYTLLIGRTVPGSATVGHVGLDDFCILLPDCPLPRARHVIQSVVRAVLDHQFEWKGRKFGCGARAGIVELSNDSASADEWMNAARFACSEAKERGSGEVVAYSAEEARIRRCQSREGFLKALQDGHIGLNVAPLSPLPEQLKQAPSPDFEASLCGVAAEDASSMLDFGTAVRWALRQSIDERTQPILANVSNELLRWIGHHGLWGVWSLVDRTLVQVALTSFARGELPIPDGGSVWIELSSDALADVGFSEFVDETLVRTGVDPARVGFVLPDSTSPGASALIRVLRERGCEFRAPM
jgi:diguanylate cyclase (GGDEF)-like protein